MIYELENFTEESQIYDNPNLCLNVAHDDIEGIIDMILTKKNIEFIDNVNIASADMLIEEVTTADGYELWTMRKESMIMSIDISNELYYEQSNIVDDVWEYITHNENVNIYSDIDKDDIFWDVDTILDYADELGLILQDDLEMIGEVDNPTYMEWVYVQDYEDREVELNKLKTECDD